MKMKSIQESSRNYVRQIQTQEAKDTFDALKVGVHIVDAKGITLLYNKACEEIEGISSQWMIGKNMEQLVKDGVYSESVALKVIETGRKVSKSQRVNDKYIFSTGIPIYQEGNLVAAVLSVMDMTKIEELKEHYNELRTINISIQEKLDLLTSLDVQKNLIISRSKIMEDIKLFALRIAKVNSTVLIEGESGVGKGVLSKFIHENSSRKDYPFVKVDCSSLPENLIESELFGYEEGAFTGAKKEGKMGLIQLANKGTLFLDEVGELPLNLQVKLLGVIQDKVFQKVGGVKDIHSDTRIIAATNRDLYRMVELGTFRKDLYYRLKVIPIHLPPIRERRDDIIPLVHHFLSKHNEQYQFNKTLSPRVLRRFLEYDWPGNVRELENEVERAVVTSEGDIIGEECILNGNIGYDEKPLGFEEKKFKDNVSDYESMLLKSYVKKSRDIRELSEITGLEVSTLRKKAKRLGIDLHFLQENGGKNSSS